MKKIKQISRKYNSDSLHLYENDCLKNILSKYDINALIKKQVNSKSQNSTRKQ